MTVQGRVEVRMPSRLVGVGATTVTFEDGIYYIEVTQGASYDARLAALETLTLNDQTGSTYTLVAGDKGKMVTFSSACTLTVPSGLGIGFYCLLFQKGAGTLTVAAGSGATVNSYSALTLSGQYATATLHSYEADVFVLSGNIA